VVLAHPQHAWGCPLEVSPKAGLGQTIASLSGCPFPVLAVAPALHLDEHLDRRRTERSLAMSMQGIEMIRQYFKASSDMNWEAAS